MNTVKVRNLELGNGIPAICIPNVGKTKEDILSLTRTYLGMHMDLMEWRMDWYEDVEDIAKVTELVKELRDVMGDTPLLCTFRTEIFTGDVIVREMIDAIHASGAKVIASNHDFDKTPAKSDLIYRLRKMQDMGADIPKMAVMPQTKKDVLTLLSATEEMASDYADRPIITMSMAGLGSISRIACEAFGSCLTFGSGAQASAPGQIGAEKLHQALQIVHDAL